MMRHVALKLKTLLLLGCFFTVAQAYERGLYINQATVEDTLKLSQLIKKAKAADVNTFVIDLERSGPLYRANVAMVQKHGLKVVSRVIIFPPQGATSANILSRTHWDRRLQLIKSALAMHVNAIQLDYIRYSS